MRSSISSLRQMHNRQFGFGSWFQSFALQIADDGMGSFVPAVDRFDHKRCPGDAVAGSKNARPGGCQGVRVDGDGLLIGDADAGIIWDKGQTSPLPNREDHRIAGDDMV